MWQAIVGVLLVSGVTLYAVFMVIARNSGHTFVAYIVRIDVVKDQYSMADTIQRTFWSLDSAKQFINELPYPYTYYLIAGYPTITRHGVVQYQYNRGVWENVQ